MDAEDLVKRYLGCMFGLASGDALGAPVEFLPREQILSTYGPEGITDYQGWGGFPAGSFTDETQMSLATAEGCIRSHQHLRARGTVSPAGILWKRYKAWLRTQDDIGERRAPGSTCLAALKNTRMPTAEIRANDSRGCGAVTRSAPIGLAFAPAEAFRYGMECGALTHGHPTGHLTAGYLAALVAHIVEGASPAQAMDRTLPLLTAHRGHEQVKRKLEEVVRLAAGATPVTAAIDELGQGWLADEALAIGAYCALKHPRDFRAAVVASVNHSGDSDSTGCIAGAILGTALGVDAIPPPWVNGIEDYDRIRTLAVDLYRVARTAAVLPQERYPVD